VTRLIFAIVNAAHRRRWLALAIVSAALVASVAGIRRLSFDSDILSLLPQDGRVLQGFRTFVGRFGNLDQLYVVYTAPAGHTIADYGDDIDAWIEALRKAPEIGRVDAGVIDRTRDFSWLADRQLLLLPPAALDEALVRFTPDGMRRAVAARRELLTVPSADVADLIRQDPLGLLDLLRDALGSTQAGVNIGMGTDGYVTADRRARLVMARPTGPPYDTTFSHQLADRLEALQASLRQRPPATDADDEPLPPMTVEFAGGHRIAVETEAVVRRESILNSVESLALILPLLFLVFRSFWLVGVGSLPSAFSLVFVLGALGFAGARLSAAATGAAAMLFGLGVDGVVLLYVSHQLAVSKSPEIDVADAIGGPSVSMMLGMVTTAATFYGLMFVDFPSLQQLGRLIGHSMMVCGVLTLILVPALLPRRSSPRARRALVMPALARAIARHRRAILWGTVLLTLGLGAASTRLRINPTLDRLRSTTDAARLEERIGPLFGLPSDVYVVLAEGDALEPLLDTNARLSADLAASIPGMVFEPPTRLLPAAATQQRAADRVKSAGFTADAVRGALERARDDAGFTPAAFEPFAARVGSLLNPPPLTYDDFVNHGLGDIIGRFIVHDQDRWLMATYAFPRNEAEANLLQTVVDRVDPAQTLTGLPLVNRELARRFLPDFIKGLSIGSAIVIVLVVLTFRSGRLSGFALLPTAVGLIWTAGLLALAGVELDLFAVFAVVTFVGIGVDYGVHLVHRYHERQDAAQATAELAPVILVAAAITLLGYASLMTSSYPPLRSIGLVSTVSVLALAVTSVLTLPALLMKEPQS
jgi:predicted exporter